MKYIILISFFLLSLSANTQNYDFGKVSKEELIEKVCDIDSSTNAAVLYQKRRTYFTASGAGIQLITSIHKRIKIYNKDGFEHASHEINLFKTRSSNETVGKIKAYTYALENDKIVKTQLDKNQIFKNEVNYRYNEVKFTMPNVKEGSIIEFKYVVNSPFVWNIDEFVFQYDIPVKNVIAEIKTPDGFEFKKTSKGYISFYPKRSSDYNSQLGMKLIVDTYRLKNVPALKKESYVDNINNYRSGLLLELDLINIPGFRRDYAQTWSDVAKRIGNTDDYEKQLDKTNLFNKNLDPILATKTNKVDKMKLIFKYVKDSIKWNGMDGKYFYKGIKKALKEKKGNAGDVNLTLVAMLRYAGIEANPVVISTKDNIIPYFPTIDRLNYVVALAIIDDKKYFLDATDEFSDINVLPVKDYNWKGILIDNNNMVWDKIDISEPEIAERIHLINATLNEDGEIEGKFSSRYTKHRAYNFRENYKDQDEDAFIASREVSLENIEISNYVVKNADEYEGFVTESFDYYQEEGADIINDKIYIAPFKMLSVKENPFKKEERLFPMDFGYPFSDEYILNISIPEGFTAESIPEPVLYKLPDNLGEFKFHPFIKGNNIQLMVNFKINKAIIYTDKYLFLKELFSQMIAKEAEQIVLTKA